MLFRVAATAPRLFHRHLLLTRTVSSWYPWSDEGKRLGLGPTLVDAPVFPPKLFFVQMGFGVDQHGGERDATKAAIRAVRNAIEFNSIPGVVSHLPGGRENMLIHVKLGIPIDPCTKTVLKIQELEIAKVFPYGKLLPFEVKVGGLSFNTGRVREEEGDPDDVGVCVAACVSLAYGDKDDSDTPIP